MANAASRAGVGRSERSSGKTRDRHAEVSHITTERPIEQLGDLA